MGFSGRNQKFKQFFRPKTGELRKKKKKGIHPKNVMKYEIRCQSTKITKIPLANTNLGLDLYSRGPEPVNFFGAQSSLGGHNFCLGVTSSRLGGHGPGMPPRGAEPDLWWLNMGKAGDLNPRKKGLVKVLLEHSALKIVEIA